MTLRFNARQAYATFVTMMTDAPKTLSQFMRAGNRYTDRDFMKALGVGHPALKQREADPSLFTLGELLVLADLLSCSKLDLLKLVLADLARNPKAAERLEGAADQVVGRKRFPRPQKAEAGSMGPQEPA